MMNWQSKQSYVYAAMKRTRELKSVESRYRALRGANPLLPNWTDTPRSGAKWSEAEEADLLMLVARSVDSGDKLTPWRIAELAWLHGRSADAVDRRLKTILSYRDYAAAVVIQ
jgi:hypothetical protein